MLKRKYKTILLATGILVVLVIINYHCLNPIQPKTLDSNVAVENRMNQAKTGYMAALTDIMIESAKALIRPVRN